MSRLCELLSNARVQQDSSAHPTRLVTFNGDGFSRNSWARTLLHDLLEKVDVLCLCETWAVVPGPGLPDVPHFSLFLDQRQGNGGTGLYLSDALHPRLLGCIDQPTLGLVKAQSRSNQGSLSPRLVNATVLVVCMSRPVPRAGT